MSRSHGPLLEGAQPLRRGAEAQGPVTALVKDLDRAQQEWQQAGKATDADAFYEHYEKGANLTDLKWTITARKVLGLATDPPTYYEDEDESGEGGGSTGGGGAEV